jgi:hypothetical protein
MLKIFENVDSKVVAGIAFAAAVALALMCALANGAHAQETPPDVVVYPTGTTATIKALTHTDGAAPTEVCLFFCADVGNRGNCIGVSGRDEVVDFVVARPIGSGDACYQAISRVPDPGVPGSYFDSPLSNKATVPDIFVFAPTLSAGGPP